MQKTNERRKRPVVPENIIETRNAVLRACSVATCHKEAAPYYDMAQKLARAWGSGAIAVMLFVGEDWLRGNKKWFPVFVEKTQFAPQYRRYLMMFQPTSRILCDFTVDFCFGGEALCDPDQQGPALCDLLNDPTLKERLAAGMKNFGMKMSVDLLIDAFTQAFYEGRKAEPEKLFAKEE